MWGAEVFCCDCFEYSKLILAIPKIHQATKASFLEASNSCPHGLKQLSRRPLHRLQNPNKRAYFQRAKIIKCSLAKHSFGSFGRKLLVQVNFILRNWYKKLRDIFLSSISATFQFFNISTLSRLSNHLHHHQLHQPITPIHYAARPFSLSRLSLVFLIHFFTFSE